MKQQHNDEVESINANNEWLDFLNGGKAKMPYLKSVGRLRKRPKVKTVSNVQRRITNG